MLPTDILTINNFATTCQLTLLTWTLTPNPNLTVYYSLLIVWGNSHVVAKLLVVSRMKVDHRSVIQFVCYVHVFPKLWHTLNSCHLTLDLTSMEDGASLRAILSHSLFSSERELFAELRAISAAGQTGTRIIIWNLRT